jgi:hypothetical protein
MNTVARRKALRALLTLVAAGLSFLFCTGCDRGWQVYQEVELGKPLPEKSPLKLHWTDEDPNRTVAYTRTVPDSKLHVWNKLGFWPLPWSTSSCKVSALADANGLAIAKSYKAGLGVNYLVVKTPAQRSVAEIRVPESLLKPLAERKALHDSDDPEADPLLEYLDEIRAELSFTPDTPPAGMQIAHIISSYGGFLMAFSMGGAHGALELSIGEVPLKGISEEGFDRTFHTVKGGSLRVQNLGGGRIRIETNLLRFYDPLDMAAFVYGTPD